MAILKQYNEATLLWETVQVGVPGPTGPAGPNSTTPGPTGPAGPASDPTALNELTARVSVISNFASPNAGGMTVGQFYDNAFQGTSSTIITGAANRIELAPYYTSTAFTADQLGVNVTTLVTGALGRIVIYNTGVDGWPDALLFEGTTAVDMGTSGYSFHTEDFAFARGIQYWVGIHVSSTARYSGINLSSAVNLGLLSATTNTYTNVLRRTVTFASGAPATWDYINAHRISNSSPPSIRMRVKNLL